jgi:hypothetical protein
MCNDFLVFGEKKEKAAATGNTPSTVRPALGLKNAAATDAF